MRVTSAVASSGIACGTVGWGYTGLVQMNESARATVDRQFFCSPVTPLFSLKEVRTAEPDG